MRIRGRGAPPPPPDLPSSPPPQPQVQDSGDQLVQSLVRNQSPPPPADDRGTTDLPVQTNGLIPSEGEGDGAEKETAKDQEIGVGEEEGGSEEMGSASPSDGRGSNGGPGPETSAAMEHWREEDRAVPLKKRRASFEMETATAEIKAEKAKKRIMRAGSKRPKKWIVGEEGEENGLRKNNGKKGRSGARIILEGSRCSRVNGRGWRCHQQTLVGYSLCEHHLGKGRLKSMTSVRSSTQTAPVLRKPTKPETNIAGEEEEEEEEEEESSDGYEGEKMNGGGVKARSMRSLLGQTMAAPVLPVTLQLSPNGKCDI